MTWIDDCFIAIGVLAVAIGILAVAIGILAWIMR